jgi:type I restriction enzyme R subunit
VIKQQDLVMEAEGDYGLEPGDGLGSAKASDKKEEFLSKIISRLNEIFIADELTDQDMVNYAYTIRDKIGENGAVMQQIENNTADQAMLGDFSKAMDDAVISSGDAHQNQMMQLLADPARKARFDRVVFDLLKGVL